jgi:2-octaprenyl-6-methoxyphenol hydroxylase
MHDVAIAGAGPVGATLALALADANLDIVVADARPAGETSRTDRTLALSHGARLIFERLGVWTLLAATKDAITPIVAIDVSQARGFGAVQLTAAELGLPALGYVVSYRALQSVLDDAMRDAGIHVHFGAPVRAVTGSPGAATVDFAEGPAIRARLGVVADGTARSVPGITRRRHDYGQVAIVAPIALDRPHRGVAYERFTAEGPVALLPERDHYALVWTRKPADAPMVLALSESAFLAALSAHFGSRMRGFIGAGERRAFPLALDVARNTRRYASRSSAMRRRHCTRLPGRGSIWAFATPGILQPSSSIRRARLSGCSRCSAGIAAGASATGAPASRLRTDLCNCSATTGHGCGCRAASA